MTRTVHSFTRYSSSAALSVLSEDADYTFQPAAHGEKPREPSSSSSSSHPDMIWASEGERGRDWARERERKTWASEGWRGRDWASEGEEIEWGGGGGDWASEGEGERERLSEWRREIEVGGGGTERARERGERETERVKERDRGGGGDWASEGEGERERTDWLRETDFQTDFTDTTR